MSTNNPTPPAAEERPEVIQVTARRVAQPAEIPVVNPEPVAAPLLGISRPRLVLAFIVAGISDLLSIATEWTPPLQWAIDLMTALALFMILGWRWILLPVMIAEAIPGLALLPLWVLVVTSIALTGTVRKPKP